MATTIIKAECGYCVTITEDTTCSRCGGTGKDIKNRDGQCHQCSGGKITSSQFIVDTRCPTHKR